MELIALTGAAGDGSVVVLPTASAPEGDATFNRWAELGLRHYSELGVSARVLDVRTRDDAQRSDHVAAVRAASLVFFSGGNPEFLARTLERTLLWSGLLEALHAGAVFAGCSAGAMVAGAARQSGPSRGRFRFSGGLGLFPADVFGVHWDSPFMRVLRPAFVRRVPTDCRLIGIAERTAILTAGVGWRVFGEGAVEVRDGLIRRTYRSGELIPEGPLADVP
ncbi:MAG TPA: Type 1 glutamine amidotransferase-like domain-containing protein [Candidatus Dormibacteraeota bacterium]|nr:Type 1 glutamine amidotransferase-like domain-containing protein [Candidatus Dormibacteraeota bacterium]